MKEGGKMKRIKLNVAKTMTFKDGCELYLLDCRQRNLREATINHYNMAEHVQHKAY